jgi:predicted transposase/invertase (TIGR01784 family)
MKNLFFKPRRGRETNEPAEFDIDEEKPINIMTDGVFKAMLTRKNEDSREALRSLISACLHREVAKVRIENNNIAPLFLGSKSVSLDVNVTFNDGEAADIEMQMRKEDYDIKRRAEYNACVLASNQKARGVDYSKVKRVYQIFFFNFVLFPASDKIPRRYYYQEEKEHDRLSDLTEIILYELPKFKKLFKDFREGKVGVEALTNEEKWCIYMKYRHEKRAKEFIKQLCRSEEGIMKAEKTVYKMSWSQSWAFYKMSREKYKRDQESIKICAQRKGHAIGLAEGHAEGEAKRTLEIARKMKVHGRPLRDIAEDTGLSVEEIDTL